MALSANRPRADWRCDAPKPLTNAGAPMTADVTQDRRVTGSGLGSSDFAFVDGSRLFWAFPSPVHERSGSGSLRPTGYKLMRCLPHTASRPSPGSQVTTFIARRPAPIRKPRTGLQPPSRSLRAASGGGLRPTLTAAAVRRNGTTIGTKTPS